MGSLLCCLRYPEDGSEAPPVCCFCLPWPFVYHGVDSVCFYHCYTAMYLLPVYFLELLHVYHYNCFVYWRVVVVRPE
jgi:hypothetical protein